MTETLYNTKEAAEKLGVSYWTVLRMVAAKQLPYTTISKTRMFTDNDIQAAIKNGRKTT